MNTIHWATQKNIKATEQESYGDRAFLAVEFTTDLLNEAELKARLAKAVRAKYPFNPTFCTNQHGGFEIQGLSNGKGLLTWETYHSIGD